MTKCSSLSKNPLNPFVISLPFSTFLSSNFLSYLSLDFFCQYGLPYITISSRWDVLIKLNFYSSNHSFSHSTCLQFFKLPNPTHSHVSLCSIFSPFQYLIIPIKVFHLKLIFFQLMPAAAPICILFYVN